MRCLHASAVALLLVASPVVAVRQRRRLSKLAARTRDIESEEAYTFAQFKSDFGREYSSEKEEAEREALFTTRRAEVVRHNLLERAGKRSHRTGINAFTDVTDEEFSARHKGRASGKGGHRSALLLDVDSEGNGAGEERVRHRVKAKTAVGRLGNSYTLKDVGKLSEAVDYTAQMRAVQNQAGCGSCWAFAATATVEGHVKMNTNKTVDLSEQNVLDCTPNPKECGGTGGCGGATSELAFEFIVKHGLQAEKSDKYIGEGGTCTQVKITDGEAEDYEADGVVTMGSFVTLPQNDYAAMMNSLANNNGPHTVSVDAGGWGSYFGGVYCDDEKWAKASSTFDIDHAVVVVGYGVDKGQKYFKIRNSWGTGWGENGYIRLCRDDADDTDAHCLMDPTPCDGIACKGECDTPVKVCGTSGVLYETSHPVKVTLIEGASLVEDGPASAGSGAESAEAKAIRRGVDDLLNELEGLVIEHPDATDEAEIMEIIKASESWARVTQMVTAHPQELMQGVQRHPSLVKFATIITNALLASSGNHNI